MPARLGAWGAPVKDAGATHPEPTLSSKDIALVSVLLLVQMVLSLFVWVLVISAVLSWLIAFNVVNTRNQFVATVADVLYRVTEPVLRPVRRVLPNLGGVDVSPIIVILLIWFLNDFIGRYIVPAVARAGL